MQIRPYDPARDYDAACRIWKEIGWLEKGHEQTFAGFVDCGRALVAEVDGQAECVVSTAPGTIRHLDEELTFAVGTGVVTSRIVRKLGAASRTLAQAVAADAADGTLVHCVGIFDQGFYGRLGYGNGAYEHTVCFAPDQLKLDLKPRVPRRISVDDFEMVHASRLARRRGHGSATMTPPDGTRMEMAQTRNGFGLGYCDASPARLSHHFWCNPGRGEHGPYYINWMTYQTHEQFLELMALIKSLSDQVHLVRMREPQGIQLQDLLDRPFRHRNITQKSEFESHIGTCAYWQMRICDLAGCMARTRLYSGPLGFNLELTDPIESFLDNDAPWRGVAGSYVVTLGPSSSAEAGSDANLPTLRASVGAFTRLWLGVRPATGLAVTDDLAGPADLLAALDRVLCLPDPKPDWDF